MITENVDYMFENVTLFGQVLAISGVKEYQYKNQLWGDRDASFQKSSWITKVEEKKILITPLENLSHFMLLFCHLLTNMCVYVCMYVCVCVCIHIHNNIRTYTHTISA
jgi:hypothetical protein